MAISGLELEQRWPAIRPFGVIGLISIIAGGLIAAIARPAGWDQGSWLAAYLVLVCGVVQIALGYGQARLSATIPTPGMLSGELVAFNLASAIVIIGSLLGSPTLTTAGGLVLGVALALLLAGVRDPDDQAPMWLLVIYRVLIIFVLGSIPVGLIMSWSRHG